MAKRLPKDILAYAILLSIDEGRSLGSGFRMKFKDYNFIITAKHVLFSDDDKIAGKTLVVTCYNPNDIEIPPTIFSVELDRAFIHFSKTHDVACILIGKNIKLYEDETPLKKLRGPVKRPTKLVPEDYITPVSVGGHAVSVDVEATRELNKIQIANDVYLMGYPTSLGLQRNSYFDFSRPLLRKGIVAGINPKEKTFIIDCPAYHGNSGGPIIEDCEDGYYRVIGLVSKYIPFETKWFNNREKIVNTEVSNSGYSVCIPMDAIIGLLDNAMTSILAEKA